MLKVDGSVSTVDHWISVVEPAATVVFAAGAVICIAEATEAQKRPRRGRRMRMVIVEGDLCLYPLYPLLESVEVYTGTPVLRQK